MMVNVLGRRQDRLTKPLSGLFFGINGESKAETDLRCEGRGFASSPSRAVRP